MPLIEVGVSVGWSRAEVGTQSPALTRRAQFLSGVCDGARDNPAK